jgi:hypothetical protein
MRHTSWLKWAAKGKPPEDFGKIVKVFRTPPRAIDDLP